MPGFDQALFEINVGGVDVTEKFNPILEHLDVHDVSGETTDYANIILADVGGRVVMPAIGEGMTIMLGWANTGVAQVFDGIVDEVASRGGRSQGRQLTISAHGFDTEGKAKEPLEFHKDKASLNDFLSEAAGKAGLSFQAESSIGSINRDYWAAGTESFIHLGQRIAHEVGAVFKISGSQAMMWPLNSPLASVGGNSSIVAQWGKGDHSGNLIDWDIAPILARPRFMQARTRYFDHMTATWKEITKAITGIGHQAAQHTHRQSRADDKEATNASTAADLNSQREAGSGKVTIKGDPAARTEGTCNVVGVRPGIDGTYRINGVNHQLTRAAGFVTHLEIKQPQGEAGVDGRATVPDTGAEVPVNPVTDTTPPGPG